MTLNERAFAHYSYSTSRLPQPSVYSHYLGQRKRPMFADFSSLKTAHKYEKLPRETLDCGGGLLAASTLAIMRD